MNLFGIGLDFLLNGIDYTIHVICMADIDISFFTIFVKYKGSNCDSSYQSKKEVASEVS
jgi:hypothetical protein